MENNSQSIINDVSITFLGVIALLIILFSDIDNKVTEIVKEEKSEIDKENKEKLKSLSEELSKIKKSIKDKKEEYKKFKSLSEEKRYKYEFIKSNNENKETDKPENGMVILNFSLDKSREKIYLSNKEFNRIKIRSILRELSRTQKGEILLKGSDGNIPEWLYRMAIQNGFSPMNKPLEYNTY